MKVLRESMVQFFGKAGIAWHGMLIMRLATAGEREAAGLSEGSFMVEYTDSIMDDMKEDGFAVLSALESGLASYLDRNPSIPRRAGACCPEDSEGESGGESGLAGLGGDIGACPEGSEDESDAEGDSSAC